MSEPIKPACPCGHGATELVWEYSARPDGESDFGLNGNYQRQVKRCPVCGHFNSTHEMKLEDLYSQDYVDATYGDKGMLNSFKRITALSPDKSDNWGRVQKVASAAAQYLTLPKKESRPPKVLDIGSGLCVFLHRLKEIGWDCTALDPDPRAAAHARDNVGVDAIAGEFGESIDLGSYDLVCFNKVLEHVLEPIKMLAQASRLLLPGGMVYLEVPDGEAAVWEGPEREEFFIEHHHVFSFRSLTQMIYSAGFLPLEIERLREPSTKFTLRAFAVPPGKTDKGN